MTEAEVWALAERVMTDAQYTAFWLRHHEDMPTEKIAQAFKVSRQAIDDRIRQGRKRLVSAIQQLEEAA